MRYSVLILTMTAFSAAAGLPATIHVPADQPTIQQAINVALAGDTVVAAPDTYVENIHFLGKAITVKSSGGPGVTIIDGGQFDSVVTFDNVEGPASILEGFTLVNGMDAMGGGIFCKEFSSPTIRGNIIAWNSATIGGGLYCEKLTSIISGNIIQLNKAGAGGGIYAWFGSPVFENNTIVKNKASNGGGMYCADNSPEIINNTFAENQAAIDGGGIVIIDAHPDVWNSIFWGNSAVSGPQIKVFPGAGVTVAHSDVEGGWAGLNNIDADPLFENPPMNDYHLTWISPCINQGANGIAPPDDIDGDTRPYMATVDMGSDEYADYLPLEADVFKIDSTAGGQVHFFLDAGGANANRNYLLLGSISGTIPGLLLPGGLAVMPVNYDFFTAIVIANLNTPVFQSFLGGLNLNGKASAKFDTLGPVLISAPVTLSFAYGVNNPWNFVSNPVSIIVTP